MRKLPNAKNLALGKFDSGCYSAELRLEPLLVKWSSFLLLEPLI